MKIISWNVKDLSAPDKKCLVKHSLYCVRSDVILLQETKLNLDKALSFLHKCGKWEGCFQESRGLVGGLGIMWNPWSFNISLIEKSKNWMLYNVAVLLEDFSFPLMNVYGPSSCEDKAKVWKEITDKSDMCGRECLVVARDFKAILDHREKKGGICRPNKSMEDFVEFVSDNNFFMWSPRMVSLYESKEERTSLISQNVWIDSWLVTGGLMINLVWNLLFFPIPCRTITLFSYQLIEALLK